MQAVRGMQHMPKRGLNLVALPQEVCATGREEQLGLAELRAQSTPATIWSPRLMPIFTLLQEILADLFAVRDHALHPQRYGGKPARGILRQYARDRQWLSAHEEHGPFSFVWVCQVLGLEASAVRRRYLSGQPVALPRRHLVGITAGQLRLESISRRAGAGKARAPQRRHTTPLNGQGHEGNGTEPAP
jgi:hypothetical protein